ncbi:hypothetical protein QN367_19680, partial [Cryobacterium sp. RTS3]|uniref:hypothetical protein n=1 Tax=Cryobacterium sp. RTS3 TaxID=3048643 RepID=UPI002B237C2B
MTVALRAALSLLTMRESLLAAPSTSVLLTPTIVTPVAPDSNTHQTMPTKTKVKISLRAQAIKIKAVV